MANSYEEAIVFAIRNIERLEDQNERQPFGLVRSGCASTIFRFYATPCKTFLLIDCDESHNYILYR